MKNTAKVKLLAISASPRKGNSQFLLEEALKCIPELPLPVETELYSFRGKNISPCRSCLKCYTNGGSCIIKDDFEELRQLWISADAVIYSVPVYVVNIPGQLKCFLDRLHNSFLGYYEVRSVRHLKAIGYMAQGGCLYGGQELAMLSIIQHAVLINSIPVAPDGSYIGSGGWAGEGVDALKDKVTKGAEDVGIALETARSVVRRTVEIAAILKAGVLEYQSILGQDPRYKPYLARITQEVDKIS